MRNIPLGNWKINRYFYNDRKIGERVLPMALEELHESAIYFLAGTRYKVKEFDYPKKQYAKLAPIPRDYPYYTKALTEEWTTIETVYEKRQAFGIEVYFCKLHIQKQVYGYVNIVLGQEVNQGQKVLLEKPLEYDCDKGNCDPRAKTYQADGIIR